MVPDTTKVIMDLLTQNEVTRKGKAADEIIKVTGCGVDKAFDIVDDLIEKGEIGEFTLKVPGGRLRSYIVPKDTSIVTSKSTKRTA